MKTLSALPLVGKRDIQIHGDFPFACYFSCFQAISTRFIDNLWVPDIYIYHMKGINRILTDFKGNKYLPNQINQELSSKVVSSL